MKSKKILLSIVTPTLNNGKDIASFISSLKNQKFPKNQLEIIISDGGSKDNTVQIAKKMGAIVMKNPYVFADPGVNLGIKKAKGNLIMVLACDNIYEEKYAFEKMVKVFDNKKINAAFPMHFSSPKDSLYTKYINTFTDPFNHFVYGDAANGRTFKKIYKTIETSSLYDVYDYTSYPDKPLIAVAQGFMVRKNFTRSRESAFDDILPVIELINKKNRIAFVHSVKLYHHTVRDIKHFIKKQVWATVNALQRKNYGITHRINYLSPVQRQRMKLWPLYALSIIFPTAYAIRRAISDKQPLWLLHPFLCMISVCSSICAATLYFYDKNYEFKR